MKRAAATLLALGASAFAWAAQPPATPPIETAGPGGSSQSAVVVDSKIAGVVLWPAVATDDGPLPAGSLSLAAQTALDAALAGEPDVRPIFEPGLGFVAVGAQLPGPDEDRLKRILARLASPPASVADGAKAALDARAARWSERWSDPLVRARFAAVALAAPGVFGAWSADADAGAAVPRGGDGAAAAVAAIRRSPIEIRAAGAAGLAGRLAAALENRIGVLAEGRPPETPAAPAAVLPAPVPSVHADEVGLALAFRVQPEDVVDLGAALPVFFESLAEGPGSLPQRLRVALNSAAGASVDVYAAPGGGAYLCLAVRAPKAQAAAAWQVLAGTVASVRALPMMEGGVFRARQRLDEQAAARNADAGATVRRLVAEEAWAWPPTDQDRPVTAVDVRQAALRVLSPDRRTAAVVGVVPDDLLAADGLKGAVRLDWSRLNVEEPSSAPRPASDPAAVAAAKAVYVALAGAAAEDALPAYVARYDVREETPLGLSRLELTVEGGAQGTQFTASTKKWTLKAKAGDEGAEAQLPGASGAATLVDADRVPALVYREPVVFAAAAARGVIPVTLHDVVVDGVSCPGLRVELDEGSVLQLALDPATRVPRAMRFWFNGKDAARAPDEEVTYVGGWRLVRGIRVAEKYKIDGGIGGAREAALLEWSWK